MFPKSVKEYHKKGLVGSETNYFYAPKFHEF